jgi:hypothetical protein
LRSGCRATPIQRVLCSSQRQRSSDVMAGLNRNSYHGGHFVGQPSAS